MWVHLVEDGEDDDGEGGEDRVIHLEVHLREEAVTRAARRESEEVPAMYGDARAGGPSEGW